MLARVAAGPSSRFRSTMPPPSPAADAGRFPSTCWSQVRIAPDASAASAEAAFTVLARRYLGPIRAWIGGAFGLRGDAADEMVQDFFAWALETQFLAKADPDRGSFRAFLKSALRNYATDRARRAQAHKRGGGVACAPLPEGGGDTLADARALRPEEALDAAWRAEVVARAVAALEADLEADGRAKVFAVFRAYYLEPEDGVDYRRIAAREGVSTVDVSNYLMRAKRRYREHLRAQVLATVGSVDSLDGELRWLLDERRR
jgi:RNA polymerase sigma-70 factor (ECF subfamily)